MIESKKPQVKSHKLSAALPLVSILAFCFLFLNSAFAQTPKTFSADSVKFLSEVDDYFSSVKGKEKEGHDFIKEQFKPFWFGGYLTDEKRMFVYNTSIALLQKKLRPFPD